MAQPGGIGAKLTEHVGPLPLWSYGVIAALIAYLYMVYESNKHKADDSQAQTADTPMVSSSNVPISNLTTAAGPMPIMMGDTFVNYTVPKTPTHSPTGVPSPIAVRYPWWRHPTIAKMPWPSAPPQSPVTQFPGGGYAI